MKSRYITAFMTSCHNIMHIIIISGSFLSRNLPSIEKHLKIGHLLPILLEWGTIHPHECGQPLTASNVPWDLSVQDLARLIDGKGYKEIRAFILALESTCNDCLGHRKLLKVLMRDTDYEYVMKISGKYANRK